MKPHVFVNWQGYATDRAAELGAKTEWAYPREHPERIDLSKRERLLKAAMVIRRLARMVRREGIELIHSHSARGNRYAWPVARLTGAKLVTHQRDNYLDDGFHRGLGRADRIIAVSNWVGATLPVAMHDRLRIVHDACSMPILPNQVDGRSRPVRIGVIGRCTKDKGIDIALRAFAVVVDKGNASMVYRGFEPNEYGEELKELRTTLGLFPDQCAFEPFSIGAEDFYQSVDLVIVPSRFAEPFGLVAIETLSHYRPVIAAGHGGLVEIVRDGITGLTFKPGDVTSLVACLRQLVGNRPLCREMGCAGRQDVEKRFTIERHTNAVMKIYEELLNSPVSSRTSEKAATY